MDEDKTVKGNLYGVPVTVTFKGGYSDIDKHDVDHDHYGNRGESAFYDKED